MKPRVLYVLGYGRSGSTVLGMALGGHPGMVNLGQISALRMFVPGPTHVGSRACGCLQPLDQCPYWRGVAQRLGSMEALVRSDAGLSPTLGWRRYAPWLTEPSAARFVCKRSRVSSLASGSASTIRPPAATTPSARVRTPSRTAERVCSLCSR